MMRLNVTVVAAAAAASIVLPSLAFAATPSITLDLRVHGSGAKEIDVSSIGESIVLDLFARCDGMDADATNDTLTILGGCFQSASGGLGVDLLGLQPAAPFNGLGSSTGIAQDLDGDGDLDVGSNNPALSTGFYMVRTPTAPRPQQPGGFLIGSVAVTVASLGGHSTEVNWLQRQNTIASLAYFDGSTTPVRVALSSITSTAPVVIRAPGPNPTPIEYLSSTIDSHVTATTRVRAAAGSIVVLTRGLDITSTGDFDMRGATGYGNHELVVND
ncbi:MAG: hypothetical protein QOF78_2643, partial [Phycisphaerales bacterium]|nr:hypothetical protein [Phycisphaerales bacterium]